MFAQTNLYERMTMPIKKIKPGKVKSADLAAFKLIQQGLDPNRYLNDIGWKTFPWQADILKDRSTRININGTRQGGKSTIISGKACHHARFFPNSLIVILAPSKKQSQENMEKIKAFINSDPNYPKLIKNSTDTIELINHSRILVLTATDNAARGFSNPDLVIFDEASRIFKTVFDAVRPMITNNPYAIIYEISTPNGKKGFFYEHSLLSRWSRYIVRSPWDVDFSGDVPTLVESTFKPSPDYHFYHSPRHFNFKDQLEALQQMGVDKYKREYCCEFNDAQDQAFSREMIESMFAQKVDRAIIDSAFNIDSYHKMQRVKVDKTLLDDLGDI